jgi:hypothetical protein
MAFKRPFSNNGRSFGGNKGGNSGGGSRGSYKGGRSFRNNGSDNNEQNYELRGIIWGNKFRDEQKEGAPVLQGYATVNGVKYRVAGFLNVGPDFKEDRGAQKFKEELARQINDLLLDAQEQVGIAFSLTFEDEEERQANNGGGQRRSSGGGGGYTSRARSNQQEDEEEEEVPFNRRGQEDDGDAEEPVEEEAPAPRARAKAATAKPAAKAARKTVVKKGAK